MISEKEKNDNKTVSIIIPTLNRAKEVVDCIDSVSKSDYPKMEIIVVDNASTDDTVVKIERKFLQGDNRIKLIKSKVNFGAGGGRNKGAEKAKGEYLLFVDSDNVIDRSMISELVKFMESHKKCGMAGPLMLFKKDPNIIWLYYADINMYTSKAEYKGTGEKNAGQYDEVIEVGHLPNCFMVRKSEFRKVDGFDERYLIMYEDADLAEKIKKKLRKKVFVYSRAVTYHDVPLPDSSVDGKFGFKTAERAYLTARNRIFFMRKNASLLQFLSFFFIFNPLIFLYYEIKLLQSLKFKKAWAYFSGNIDGFLNFS